MHLYRSALTSILAFVVLCPLRAQEQKGFFGRVLDKIVAPSRELDPAAVYQPKPRWTLAVTGDLRQAGVSQEQEFTLPSAKLGPSGEMIVIQNPVFLSSNLQGKVNKGLGFQAGYGNLSVAVSKSFLGEGTNSVFSLDYLSAGYALQVQYLLFSDQVHYYMVMGENGSAGFREWDEMTDNPGQMRSFIVDAFYAFNRRSFAYSAAYKGNMFQKRSAGSWMFGSKLILGEFSIDPREQIVDWAAGQAKQTSSQLSFGGGYSYNFVPFHRQPYGPREKGLRNLTLNATLLPMVTIFNQFAVTAYEQEGDGSYTEAAKYTMNGKLLVNYVARIGIGYTHDLFSVNLSASHDDFSYKGVNSLNYRGYLSEEVDTSGNFFQWMVALRLGVRF